MLHLPQKLHVLPLHGLLELTAIDLLRAFPDNANRNSYVVAIAERCSKHWRAVLKAKLTATQTTRCYLTIHSRCSELRHIGYCSPTTAYSKVYYFDLHFFWIKDADIDRLPSPEQSRLEQYNKTDVATLWFTVAQHHQNLDFNNHL